MYNKKIKAFDYIIYIHVIITNIKKQKLIKNEISFINIAFFKLIQHIYIKKNFQNIQNKCKNLIFIL